MFGAEVGSQVLPPVVLDCFVGVAGAGSLGVVERGRLRGAVGGITTPDGNGRGDAVGAGDGFVADGQGVSSASLGNSS